MSGKSEDLDALRAQYAELEAEYKRGELLAVEWSTIRRALEERIAAAGGGPPSLDDRLEAINRDFQKKMLRDTRRYATEWLRRDEMLGWLAEQFDAAEGPTVDRLEAMLVALRARVIDET